ncbi:hypothetical protein F2Q70_00031293 [Brassica cretica]|uniref:P-type phospholipid transporter n=1 Tax=Brassica cretica TaxID=69181 RepID=A0A8S9FDR3_BRACR|nr:hypothetical protein F2Q70_00031293 [Brassica cretica]
MKRFVYINDDEASKELCCDNRISNTKYTLWNFFPKNLLEQFSRFMNQYFLLIACLQLWSLITPVNPASTWGPLIFIFAVSASKEAWDDYHRYLSDKKANEREVWIVKHGIKKHIQAQDIQVGNIVWLRENDEVPCDLVLLGTSDPQGVCYVETAALDGETDLKTRVIPSACVGIDLELLHKMKGVIECPIPDKDIRRFDANMRLFPPFIDNDVCSLTIKNTLLQSCYLRNTEWACGVSVYTGNQTKLGMCRGVAEPKLTAMDAMIDKLTGAIFVFQIVVVMVLGVAGNVWKDTEARKQWYVQYPEEAPWYELLVIPLRFELLCSIMIPISIKVSLDLVKGLYAKFIEWDVEMYPEEAPWYELLVIPLRFELLCSIMIPISIKVSLDLVKGLYAKFIEWDVEMVDQETGTASYAANTAISEDLGQVEYILTDKTGTLTDNKMIFRRCCIGGIFYGNENGDALKDTQLLDAITSGSTDVIRFLTVMAICNTVIPVRSKAGDIIYKAQSQDEDALVIAAAKLHMVFVGKNANLLELMFNGEMLRYEVLEILEFTSDRKRMSVVVKDSQNGKIILLSKGADESILPSARAGQHTRTIAEAVEHYAQLGLRTLCLAWRELEEDEYLEWTAICCRVTPSQKAQLVEILKSCDYRTLAIGDGGNDVRMIQQADIGVGISGREGLQAARAADYSIGRFRFLKRLILVHGRYSYNRTAFLSQYSFYKSLLICFIQIFFSFISGVSGTSLFNSVSLMAYNVFYTSVPVLVSVIDKDLSETTVMQHPQILFYCQAGRLLNPSTFAGWFGRSLFHEGRAGEFLFRRSSCFLVAGKLSDKGPIEGWGWGVRKSKSAVEHPATAPLVRISTTFFMN